MPRPDPVLSPRADFLRVYGEARGLECASHAILLANVCCSTAALLNPPARRAAPFAKGGSWVPSFFKGGTGRISPAASPRLRFGSPQPCCGREAAKHGFAPRKREPRSRTPRLSTIYPIVHSSKRAVGPRARGGPEGGSEVSHYRDRRRLSCGIHRRSWLPSTAPELRNVRILHGLPATRPA
jgi:hypothetical protein